MLSMLVYRYKESLFKHFVCKGHALCVFRCRSDKKNNGQPKKMHTTRSQQTVHSRRATDFCLPPCAQ
eukprot:5218289-Amphidinium_carterae.1